MSLRTIAIVTASLALLTACQSVDEGGQGGSRAWSRFQADYIEAAFKDDPANAASQGRHEYDGILPDWSEAGLARSIDFYKTSIAKAQAFQNLNEQQSFERDYLTAVARKSLFWRETADQPHTNPA